MGSPDDDHSEGSLFGRLNARYGAEVNPWITLEDERPTPRPSPSPSPSPRASAGDDDSAARPASSGLLDRLRGRPLGGGRYRVDGEIGRGGMGAILDVWDEDLRRHLAMKVALGRASSGSGGALASGELDPRMLARFLEEAQVTGQLEHPGIVPVHELGMDENGQVFFTMRRVQGRDLEHVFGQVTRGEDGWNTTRAIGVLSKVCDAMAYAHSRGVVHRDLKPANVMVGRFGEVYVMDWGLVRVRGQTDRHDVRVAERAGGAARGVDTDARVDGSGQSGDALYTMDGDVLGTPAYMPPEQARGELEALDARSDVYSLGAMLYRLLAGVAPYADGEQKRNALKVLQELRAQSPTPLASLAPSAPAELVAITEKAMSRDAAERYADMSELRDDLAAFLEQRVVGAYETGAVAEARKWVRRNRPLAASLAAGLLVLVGGLAFSLVQKQRADDNAVRALAAADLAEARRIEADANADAAARQTRVASEVNSFLNNDLLAAIDPEKQGIDVTVREVLEEASTRLVGRFPDEPLIEAELRSTLANSFHTLGDYEAALPHARRALALRTEHLGPDDPATLAAADGTAQVLDQMAQYDEALALYADTLTRMRSVHGPASRETLDVMRNQAMAASHDGDLARSAEILQAVRELEDPSSLDALRTAADLGVTFSHMGRLDEAEHELRRVLELNSVLRGAEHLETVAAKSNLSVLLVDLGDYDEAWRLEHEAYEGELKLLGPDHQRVGQSLVNLAVVELSTGAYDDAERHALEGIAILRRSLSPEHDRVLLAVNNLCTVLGEQGRNEEQLELLSANTATLRRVHGDEHPTTMLSMSNLAILLLQVGRIPDSKRAHEEILAIERRVRGSDHPSTLATLENYGNVLYTLRDYAGAIAAVEEVLATRTRVLGADHPAVARTNFNLGMVYKFSGDEERAGPVFTEAARIWSETTGLDHFEGATSIMELANLARHAGDLTRAVELYERALEHWRAFDPRHPNVGYVLHQIAISLHNAGRHAEGLVPGREAFAFRRELLGDDHLETLTTEYVLCSVLRKLEQWEEAELLAHDYHDRSLATHGAGHEFTRKGRAALVTILTDQGKHTEADAWR